jgi:hypothetical protein
MRCVDCGERVSTPTTARCLPCRIQFVRGRAATRPRTPGGSLKSGTCSDCGGLTMGPRNARCRACYMERRSGHLRPTERPTIRDIVLAAGWFEGEGTCNIDKGGCSRLRVAQNDRWMLERLRALFGGCIQSFPANRGGFHRTASHGWYLSAARARGFLMTIYVLLSPRRQAQVRRALGLDQNPS